MMTDAALEYLDRSGGWEVGVGPSIVVFDQKGLMAGAGLQGSKITRLR